MKKNTGNAIKLGVFVTFAVLFFIIAIYFIGQKQRLFSTVFNANGIFKNVNGLQVGNNVRFAGINVGTVKNIEIISDTAIKVEMILEEDIRRFIKKGRESGNRLRRPDGE